MYTVQVGTITLSTEAYLKPGIDKDVREAIKEYDDRIQAELLPKLKEIAGAQFYAPATTTLY